MFPCNVNNSISHPPHPRRAVPANLPPGAFFSSTGISRFLVKFFSFLCGSFILLCATASAESDLSVADKIAALRTKSSAHNRFVTELLAQKFQRIEVAPPVKEMVPPVFKDDPPAEVVSSVNDLPEVFLPTNEYTDETESPREFVYNDPPSAPVEESEPSFDVLVGEAEYQPAGSTLYTSEGVPVPTYDDLYSPKFPQRRIGYYFGPFLALAFPDNSALGASSIKYESKTGISTGIRMGKDFGTSRFEGEYSFLTSKITAGALSGRSNLHNFTSRLILEKNLGEQADFRAGLGLGFGFVDQDLGGAQYDGVGFSYDFLLGWSYRIQNNWSIGVDYRYYLTAAHEDYDRLQGHIIEFSAGFDL